MKPTTYNAALYLRLSRDDGESGESTSHAAQICRTKPFQYCR